MNLGLLKANIDVGNNRLERAVAQAIGHSITGGVSAATHDISMILREKSFDPGSISPDQIKSHLQNFSVDVDTLLNKTKVVFSGLSNGCAHEYTDADIDRLQQDMDEILKKSQTHIDVSKIDGSISSTTGSDKQYWQELKKGVTKFDSSLQEANAVLGRVKSAWASVKQDNEQVRRQNQDLSNKLKQAEQALVVARQNNAVALAAAQKAQTAHAAKSNTETRTKLNEALNELKTLKTRYNTATRDVERLRMELDNANIVRTPQEQAKYEGKVKAAKMRRAEEVKKILAKRLVDYPASKYREIKLDEFDKIVSDAEENQWYRWGLTTDEYSTVTLDKDRPTRVLKTPGTVFNSYEVVKFVNKDELLRRQAQTQTPATTGVPPSNQASTPSPPPPSSTGPGISARVGTIAGNAVVGAGRVAGRAALSAAGGLANATMGAATAVGDAMRSGGEAQANTGTTPGQTPAGRDDEPPPGAVYNNNDAQGSREGGGVEETKTGSGGDGDISQVQSNLDVIESIKLYFEKTNKEKVDPSRRELVHTYGKFLYGGKDQNKLFNTGVPTHKLPNNSIHTGFMKSFVDGTIYVDVNGKRTAVPLTEGNKVNILKKKFDEINAWATIQPNWGEFTPNESSFVIMYIIHLQGLQDMDGNTLIEPNQKLLGDPGGSYEQSPFSSMFLWM